MFDCGDSITRGLVASWAGQTASVSGVAVKVRRPSGQPIRQDFESGKSERKGSPEVLWHLEHSGGTGLAD